MINVTFRWLKEDGEVEYENARVEVLPRVGDEVDLNSDYYIVERVTHRIDTIERNDYPILITLGNHPEMDFDYLKKRLEKEAAKPLTDRLDKAMAEEHDMEELVEVEIDPTSASDLAESTLAALSSLGKPNERITVIGPPELTEDRLRHLIDKADDDHVRDFGW